MNVRIELGCEKFPSEKDLPKFWNENRAPLLAFLTQVFRGVRGFVFDEETKSAISGAVISVQGIEHNVTSSRDGDFFRVLSSGTYNISVTRLGYRTERKENVLVDERSSTYLEFRLKRTGSTGANAASPIVTIYTRTKNLLRSRILGLSITGSSVSLFFPLRSSRLSLQS